MSQDRRNWIGMNVELNWTEEEAMVYFIEKEGKLVRHIISTDPELVDQRLEKGERIKCETTLASLFQDAPIYVFVSVGAQPVEH